MRLFLRWVVAVTVVAAVGSLAGPACGADSKKSDGPKWFDEGVPAEIIGTRVNIRSGPGTKHEIAGAAKRGQAVQVFAQAGGWYQISLPENNVCWVAKRVIQPDRTVTSKARSTPVPALVKSESIYVRAAGNLKAKVLVEVTRGGQVQIVGQIGDWYKVRPPAGARAWIYGDYVHLRPERVSPDPEPARFRRGQKPALDPAVKATYQKAEAAWMSAKAAGPLVGNFARPMRLYQQIVESDKAPESLREHSRKRIAVIAKSMPLSQKRQFQSERQKAFVTKMRNIRDSFATKKVEEPKRTFDAKGTVYRLSGRDRPATHRLKVGDITLYLLKSKTVDIEAYVGKRVGIAGSFKNVPAGWAGAAGEVITVEAIEVLQ